MFKYIWHLAYSRPIWKDLTLLLIITIYLPFDFTLRIIRLLADLFSEAIGLIYIPKRKCLPPLTDALLLKSATELTSQIRSGQLLSETLVRAYINRIKQVNGHINALVSDRFEEAITEAKALDQRISNAIQSPSPTTDDVLQLTLLGIPLSIKESIAVKGQPNSAGLYSRRNILVSEDAIAVKRLKDSGAIIVGVTNTPEFLLWWDTDNRLYGRTNNPYDLSRICGGSSGGEAALISAGGSLLGLGSDLVGSIRIPSFFCGVFGHKPSSHVVSMEGVYPYCGHSQREKMSVLGPICRYAVDLKLVLNQIVLDKSALKLDQPVDLHKSKFYFMTSDNDPLKSKVSSEVVQAINSARGFLSSQGYCCETANLPLFRDSFWMWMCSFVDMDGHCRLACEVMQRQGELNGWTELIKALTVGSKYRKITCLNVILENMFYSPKTRDWYLFRAAVNRCYYLKTLLENLLEDDAILVLPCLPDVAPKHNGTFLRMPNCGYTGIFNVFEMPVTYVTIGLGKQSGLPVGFQIVAKRLNDRFTIATAELLSTKFGGWIPPFDVTI